MVPQDGPKIEVNFMGLPQKKAIVSCDKDCQRVDLCFVSIDVDKYQMSCQFSPLRFSLVFLVSQALNLASKKWS